MEAKAKEKLHHLVERVPDGEVHTAERFLEYLASSDDPVMRALMNAPEMRDMKNIPSVASPPSITIRPSGKSGESRTATSSGARSRSSSPAACF